MGPKQKNKLGLNMQHTDSDKTDINILLLGETGVGKSTFINSFANYLQYTDLVTAEKSELLALIPAKFTIPDENFVERIVEIGKDKNENCEVGVSATQGTKAYVFPLKDENRKIRLIDTPGIGDTKGMNQDDINFENILSFISQFTHLHGICFLLKPNVSRINVYFKYCLQHLLSHLEKSASSNILFVFTNTRSTFYRPGETLSSLNKILKEVEDQPPNVKIPCSKKNMFCVDNEAFKFLVALKNNISFSEQEKKDYGSSWETSVTACWNMLSYIVGDNKNPGLKPHLVENTLSINQARRLIINLSKPLADITDLINDNITVLTRHQGRIMQENMSKEELMKVLYVPTVNLKDNKLQQPVTVCTHVGCCEIYPVAEVNKYHYKQRCHNPCYLNNVPKDLVGSPELINCAAMSGKKCTVCGCDFSVHMHIYYETTIFEDRIENHTVKKQLKSADDIIKAQFDLINEIHVRQQDYQAEKKIISKSTAKFAHFLKENSITPYNDAFSDYIKYLIDRENGLGSNRNLVVIKHYEEVLKQHDEEKTILDNALFESKKISSTSAIITPQAVFDSVKTLYTLKHNGDYIKKLHEKEESLRRNEHENSMEYFHWQEISKPKQKKKKPENSPNNSPNDSQNNDIQHIKKMLQSLVNQDTKKDVDQTQKEKDENELTSIKIKLENLNVSDLKCKDVSAAELLKIISRYFKDNSKQNSRGNADAKNFKGNKGRGNFQNNRGAVPKTPFNYNHPRNVNTNPNYGQGYNNTHANNTNVGRGFQNQFGNSHNNRGSRQFVGSNNGPGNYQDQQGYSPRVQNQGSYKPNQNNYPNYGPDNQDQGAKSYPNRYQDQSNNQNNYARQQNEFGQNQGANSYPNRNPDQSINQNNYARQQNEFGQNQGANSYPNRNQDQSNNQNSYARQQNEFDRPNNFANYPNYGNIGNNPNLNFGPEHSQNISGNDNRRGHNSYSNSNRRIVQDKSSNNTNQCNQFENSGFPQERDGRSQSNFNQRRGRHNNTRNRSRSRNKLDMEDNLNNLDINAVKNNISKTFESKQKNGNRVNQKPTSFKKYGTKRINAKCMSNNDTTSEVTSNSSDDNIDSDMVVVESTKKEVVKSIADMKKFIEEQKDLWREKNNEPLRRDETPKKKLSFFDSLLKFTK